MSEVPLYATCGVHESPVGTRVHAAAVERTWHIRLGLIIMSDKNPEPKSKSRVEDSHGQLEGESPYIF